MEKNTQLKSRRAKIFLLVMIIIGFFSISLSSGFEFDNSKVYNENLKQVTVTNAFGIGDEIAKIKLITPQHVNVDLNSCEGGYGKDCLVAEIEINSNEKYTNTFNLLEFYNKRSMVKQINRKFIYKYKVLDGKKTKDIYGLVCEKSLINNSNVCEFRKTGEEEVDNYKWINFDSKSGVNVGITNIGIFTDVRDGELTEWIPTLFGIKIDEWADFGTATKVEYFEYTNGLGSFGGVAWKGHPFRIGINSTFGTDDVTLKGVAINTGTAGGGAIGRIVNVTLWISDNTGKPITPTASYNLSNSSDLIDGWNNLSMTTEYLMLYQHNYSLVISCPTCTSTISLKSQSGPPPTYHYQRQISGDSGTTWTTDAEYQTFQIWGESAGAGGSISNVTVSLLLPADSATFTYSNLSFNASFITTSLNLTNATLYVWRPDNSLLNKNFTTITGTENATRLDMSGLTFGTNYKWNYLGCGTNSSSTVCMFSYENRTFSINSFSTSGEFYNNDTFETKRELFVVNFSAQPNIISITGDLVYNGTFYPATVTNLPGNVYNLERYIDAPLSPATRNYTFFWKLLVTDETGVYNSNTTNRVQWVNNSYIAECNDVTANATANSVNFTTYNAINPNPIINSTFKATFNYYLGTGSVVENYSFEDISEGSNSSMGNSSFKFCVYPTNYNYNTNAIFEFDATGYSLNHHYYEGVVLNTTQLEQPLYLLNESLSTLTVLKVVDSVQRGIPDQVINIQLYDVGTGQYKLVGMAKTNYNGEDIVYLNWFDSFYRFLITNNRSVIYSTDPYKVSSTPQKFRIVTTQEFEQDKFSQVQYSLYYNNVTGNFVLIYNDPTQRISAGCLKVSKLGVTNYSILYDNCANSTSATLSYNIGVGNNGTYSASFYAKGSPLKDISSIIVNIIDVANDIYSKIGNLDGTTVTIIIVACAGFIGIFAGAGVFVLFALGGYILAVVLGFQPVTMLGSAEFLGFIAIGGYLIWKIKN